MKRELEHNVRDEKERKGLWQKSTLKSAKIGLFLKGRQRQSGRSQKMKSFAGNERKIFSVNFG